MVHHALMSNIPFFLLTSNIPFFLLLSNIPIHLIGTMGKEINSQPCYDSGEVTSFNIPEVETLVGDIFVDVYVLIIDDYPADMETRTSISDDPEDGIMPINVTSRGEDVLPPPPQPILESKDEINGFRLCISLYGLYEEIQRGTHPIDIGYIWIKDATILKYMMGKLPDYDKTWMDVNFIYMPYNIKGCHCVLIRLHMVEGKINVWDSFIDLTLDLDLDKELDNMRCVVPILLHRGDVFTMKPNLRSIP
ncbi:Ulp1-like peptidase [Cucumis melo var. makuwa]|uniref:Ulp1-like peptidase n=1 Tax=Cucumis melo var. makuwa TaxID=1194695 RepID=A0A5A7VKG9_CUCMM|nr:Ulp1-like peptidase [Cucumis melo var. makuwa]